MFNMGGRINQATGTGITSGLDTPRRGLVQQPGGYAGRTADEIEAEILKVYPEKTPQQKGFDILESYGNLPSAYKDGEYRTIGERLDMRSASYEKKLAEEVALQNKAKLAVLESDMAKNTADDLAANALERTIAGQSDNLGNSLPYARQLFNETNRLSKMLENPQFGPTKAFVTANLNSIAKANVDIAKLQAEGSGDNLMTIPEAAYELTEDGKWKYSPKNLIPGLVYFDVVQRLYVVPTSATTSMKYPTYEEANAALQGDKNVSAISTDNKEPIKVEKTEGIKTVSLHPVKDGSTEVTDEYVLQYIEDNNIITDAAEYRAIEDKENYTLLSINQVKIKLKKENIATVRQEETDKKTYARKEREALNWFKRNYERYINGDGRVQMPDRFKEFEEIYLGTLAVKVAEKPEELAAGGRAGYAMGSPEFQGEVVTEELEEIQPDTSVDELADLQTWWKSEIEKDFNA